MICSRATIGSGNRPCRLLSLLGFQFQRFFQFSGCFSATNLKEITVTFDGTVDKASAQDLDKYSVDSSVELESATLLEDGKTVRLTVKPFANGLVLQNQKAYKLSVKNVKAGDKFVDASNVAFTPVDNILPEVSEVKSLGTSAIKVTFSEPVKTATSANFKLDGKSFFGSVSEGSRSVILKPYSATDLTVGDHKLEVTGVEDFAGFKSLTKEFSFSVVEDLVAPTVKSVSATLEKVTVTFSEEVDPETVVKSNIYWMSGTDKKAAGSVTQIAPDVYEFDFSANSLPGYEVTLFVEGVKDYSGNKITETEVKVRAEVDQTRPEVSEVTISKLNTKNITIKFNKTVKVDDIKYFTLTDSAGKAVALRNVVAANGTTMDKTFTIETYGELTDSYTLKVVGVRDTTKLQNTMNDYSVTLTGNDTVAPSYTSNSANSATRTIIVNFDEKMELATLADHKNYLVTINGKSQQLPSGTEVTPVQNGEAVRIVLPEYIDNATVGINDSTKGANVTAFKLLALKDLSGNIISNFGGADILANTSLATLVAAYDSTTVNGENAKLTGKGVIKVKFNQPIGKAAVSDFVLTSGTGVSISSVTADGSDVVTVTLSGNVNDTGLYDLEAAPNAIALALSATNKITTTSGNGVVQSAVAVNTKDTVKPQVKLASGQSRLDVVANKIVVPFSEALVNTTADSVLVGKYANDLVITNVRTGAILPVDKYSTSVNSATPTKLEITLDASVSTVDEYRVAVKESASFIQDTTGNKAVSSSAYLTTVGGIDTVAPTVTNVTSSVANGMYKVGDIIPVQVTFNEAVNVAVSNPTLLLETGAPDRTATYASGTGTNTLVFNYTVQVGDLSADLDVEASAIITLAGSSTIKDAAGNDAVLTLKAPGTTNSLGANKAIVIDGVAVTGTTTVSTKDTVVAAATTTVTFSEELDADSKTAVETAIKGAVGGVVGSDLGFAWVAGVLTVTNNHATIAATFAADATVTNVKDLAGNNTASVVIDLNS